MPSADIEEFARKLVQQVRDAAVTSCDRQLEAGSRSPMALRWAQALSSGSTELARTVIPDCVDETIFYLLRAIDEGGLRLSYTDDDSGADVDLSEEGLGELSGWYMGSGGWRAQYSEQRFVDDFGDIGTDGPK